MPNIDNQTIKIANLLKKTAPFLKDFLFNRFVEKNGMNLWVFTHKFPDYTFRIIFGEKNNQWRVKIFVYWKNKTHEPTLGAGKDFEFQIGPFSNVLDAIKEVDKKLQNNPIMGHHLYHDDFELNMDKEALPLLQMLKSSSEKLSSIGDVYFDDLKKIYNAIKNVPEDKLLNYCTINNPKEADKQDFLLDLQKIHKLDFYHTMKGMGHFG